MLDSLPTEIAAGVALAMAIYKVAAQLLRLIPQDEATRTVYRRIRLGIIVAAALLVLAVMMAAVGLYLARAFGGALPAPI